MRHYRPAGRWQEATRPVAARAAESEAACADATAAELRGADARGGRYRGLIQRNLYAKTAAIGSDGRRVVAEAGVDRTVDRA